LFIKAYQDIFVLNQVPDFVNLLKLSIMAHLLLLAGYVIFKKFERDLRDFL
jgi:ABC-type polysaccharide/polyol phosphate export permease